ncbi:MAG TPA: bifunctional YncE family protein/alkaline phosphatase family protein [Terriglobales bacterium]|nr:bifunctional YncE family protein/alkaline phosphatase family protein [Terriglobales bacterium]
MPTSKRLIGPSPGVFGQLDGFTPTIALSPDRHYAALLNDGYGTQRNQAHESIAILDLKTNQITGFPEQRLSEDTYQSYFIGLAFSSDGAYLYASMGSITDPTGEKPGNTGNGIAVYSFQQGKVAWERFLKIPPQRVAAGKKVAHGIRKTAAGTVLPYPAGLAVIAESGKRDRLLVADNYADNVVLVDTADGKILKTFDLSAHDLVPSEFPYTVVATRDGTRAWVSLWNASQVVELDLAEGSVKDKVSVMPPADPLAPGSHPTALLLSPDESLLYVALANTDRVIVLATEDGSRVGVLDTRVPGQKFGGAYPSALAQSADGKRLFVADASLDAVAVFDVSHIGHRPLAVLPLDAPLGLIPTDWYPTALATVGDDLLIATSKGQGTTPNKGPGGTSWERRHKEHPYIPTLLYGSVARVRLRDVDEQLSELTEQVRQNNLLKADPGTIQFAQGSNPIHHVIYILKENRTYDQVLGDLKVGNGDTSLTMYGADVTPNEHKLALQFGVLDNFYDSGEVSGDGHDWSTAAIASDYNENTWQIAYRSKERTYDFSGTVADEFPLEHDEADVDAPGTGYIWDNVARQGLSYRDYGEFVTTIWCEPEKVKSPKQGTPSPFSAGCPRAAVSKGEELPENLGEPRGRKSPWPWSVPMLKMGKATKAVLRGHFDTKFPDFNTEYPDQLRADEFLNEFEGFVRARGTGKGTELPAFVLLYLPDDHTHGTTAGKPRPAASVADNDLAVGRVVEAVSHSPYWDDTAILMLEDDAQDGADHVDAHRSIAFVISKYSPGSAEQPYVAHQFYTTVNMIHTLEALLGLPPMNQNDAYAPVMAPLFTGKGDQTPFVADWSNRDNGLIYQVNPRRGPGAKESAKMDFTRPDKANPAVLNAILWRDRKGNAPVPVAKHAILPAAEREKD